jgi:hypothetical protein
MWYDGILICNTFVIYQSPKLKLDGFFIIKPGKKTAWLIVCKDTTFEGLKQVVGQESTSCSVFPARLRRSGKAFFIFHLLLNVVAQRKSRLCRGRMQTPMLPKFFVRVFRCISQNK